jgi:hypothetical protein
LEQIKPKSQNSNSIAWLHQSATVPEVVNNILRFSGYQSGNREVSRRTAPFNLTRLAAQ